MTQSKPAASAVRTSVVARLQLGFLALAEAVIGVWTPWLLSWAGCCGAIAPERRLRY
jgi:hypothetical protein